MASSQVWRLKRYGRLIPGTGEIGSKPWKVFDANGDEPEIVLTILECGYFLVLQGRECLDTISLLCASDFVKVRQKKDNLMLRYTVRGESRLIRMQFDGSSKAEAIKECSSAVEKLREYVPISTQDDAPPPPNQPPTEVSAPEIQQGNTMGIEPEVVRGSSSIKSLTQSILGTPVILPQFYHHGPLEEGDLEPFLRVCLLDPSFHTFVEKVEGELKKLLEE
ncbi:meiotic recombination protein REC114 [Aulostomus maculatus]